MSDDELSAVEQRLVRLMSIDSTTGSEGPLVDELRQLLGAEGFTIAEQTVEGTRRNVMASWGTPQVVLTTHLDTVPPFIAPRWDSEKIHGRGSCDAKGSMSAMIEAALRLKAQGHRDFGLLFVAGEETDSAGAKQFAKQPLSREIRYLIDGEPTGNRLTKGYKGVFAFHLKRTGVPGHSAYPELFRSATHPLIADLAKLLALQLPSDAVFGDTTVNVGKISGGKAANIVAAEAEAEVIVRLAKPVTEIKPLVLAALDGETALEVRSESNPATMFVPDGFDADIVRFGSDVPHLRPVAEVLLVGPGSIHDAHTDHEFVLRADLAAAVDLYVGLVLRLQRDLQTNKSGA